MEIPKNWIWFPFLQFCYSIRWDSRTETFKRRTANSILDFSGSHVLTTTRRMLRRQPAPRGTVPNEVESIPESSILDQLEKCSRQRIRYFWQTNSIAFILDTSVPADCLEKVVHTKTGEILHQRIHLSPRLPPTVILKSVWQVHHEGQVQHKGSEKPVADQTTITPKNRFEISRYTT